AEVLGPRRFRQQIVLPCTLISRERIGGMREGRRRAGRLRLRFMLGRGRSAARRAGPGKRGQAPRRGVLRGRRVLVDARRLGDARLGDAGVFRVLAGYGLAAVFEVVPAGGFLLGAIFSTHQPPDAVFGALALVICVGSRLPVVCVAPAKGASILRTGRTIVVYHSYLIQQLDLPVL